MISLQGDSHQVQLVLAVSDSGKQAAPAASEQIVDAGAVTGSNISMSLSPRCLQHMGLDSLAVALQLEHSETDGTCLRSIHPLEPAHLSLP